MNKTTKKITLTAIFVALYFVLSTLLKIPVTEHITLDLGYIALTVGCVYFGAASGATIGALGAFLESAVLSQRGISPGWILMNAIVGALCGFVLHKAVNESRKKFILYGCLVIPLSMLLGVTVKTLVDCALYSLPLLAKIPTGIAAWVTDSIVMTAIGLPLSLILKKQIGMKLMN